jgi:ribonuclease HI
MKYYAIKTDNEKFIFESWDEAKEKMKSLVNPKHKSFSTKEEAEAFLEDRVYLDGVSEPKAYVDGSYNEKNNSYGFGVVLIIDNKEYHFSKGYEEDEYSSFRNVAGEIKGVAYIINYALKKSLDRLHIFYDYEGIEAWYTNRWNQNTLISKKYAEFRDTVKDKIEVVFHKVKGHSNNHYNDLADKLAKEALGIK